ncbi:MAG: phage/plasmid primase, P4 family [Gammaproteobacteria bacterium]|nr:phage/plasmid primase, P4 family [Gammaproteobacteria bacterium]
MADQKPWVPKHFVTEGYNDGRSAKDLFKQGIVGQAFYDYIKARLKDGPPQIHIEHPDKKRTPKPTMSAVPAATSNVTSLAAHAEELARAQPDEELAFLPPEFSEDAMAEKFTDKYSDRLKFCGPQMKWYVWLGNRWDRDETFIDMDYARKICKVGASHALTRLELGAKKDRIADALSKLRMYTAVTKIARTDRRHQVNPTRFDARAWILNTPGGLIDLKTGDMRPCRADDWCTRMTSVAPGGECPRWLKFIDDCTKQDAELKRYLKRVIGYCLTGTIIEHKFFFVYGTGGNGKGTFVNTFNHLLGTYSKVANVDTFTQQRFAKHPTELAWFQGSRLLNAQEIPEGSRWNETRIKMLTGGDPITARHMYESEFTYFPTFKLLFTGNHKPILRNVDDAIRRRLFLIPFEHKVAKKDIEDDLEECFKTTEAGGILQWAIDGCLDWQHNSLNPPDRVRMSTDEYFDSEDTIGTFLAECCEIGAGHRELTARLYRRYCDWCDTNNEYRLSNHRFLPKIAAKGYKSKNRGGQMSVTGLRLPDNYNP